MLQKPEFSRIIEISPLILDKNDEISANPSEMAMLAERFSVKKINSLRLEYIIMNKEDISGAFILSARLISNIIKFSIEEYEEEINIDEKFEVVLIDEATAKLNLELLKEFDIEILDENFVDIGEITSQYLSLCVYM